MTIYLKKFGDVLTSRQAGKEAYAAFLPTLAGVPSGEQVVVDCSGVITLSPSWADEFLIALQEKFGDRLVLKHTENPSVALTVSMLEKIHGIRFKIQK